MKRYVVGLVMAALSSGAALAVVLVFLNPYSAQWIGVTLLLTSVFFLVASVFTLIGFTVRVLRSRKEVVYAHLATAFRQGLLLALIVVGCLLLQVFRIFNIWSALLFVAAIVLIELAFASHTSSLERRSSGHLGQPNDPRTGPLHPLNPNNKLSDITVKSSASQAEPWKTRFPTTKKPSESPKPAPSKPSAVARVPDKETPKPVEPEPTKPKLEKPKSVVRRIPVRTMDGPQPPEKPAE